MKISKQELKHLVESVVIEQFDSVNTLYSKTYEDVLDAFTNFDKKLQTYYKVVPEGEKQKIREIFRINREIEKILLEG